ncbi:MAG: DUF4923 family protein [Alistipes sp.]|nr:DUF4923 family protein [Alistipes sp.]
MKKIALIVALLFTTATVNNISAQSLQSLFEGLTKMFTEPAASEPETPKVVYPTAKEITGRWSYQQLALEYTGNSTIASLAVSSAATQLSTLANKFGLVAGKDYVKVKNDGTMLFVSSDRKVEAKYTYVEPTGQLIVTMNKDGKNLTFTGSLSKVDGNLKIMFKASEMIAKAELVSSKMKDNSTFAILKELIGSYPGIIGGAIFSK